VLTGERKKTERQDGRKTPTSSHIASGLKKNKKRTSIGASGEQTKRSRRLGKGGTTVGVANKRKKGKKSSQGESKKGGRVNAEKDGQD